MTTTVSSHTTFVFKVCDLYQVAVPFDLDRDVRNRHCGSAWFPSIYAGKFQCNKTKLGKTFSHYNIYLPFEI